MSTVIFGLMRWSEERGCRFNQNTSNGFIKSGDLSAQREIGDCLPSRFIQVRAGCESHVRTSASKFPTPNFHRLQLLSSFAKWNMRGAGLAIGSCSQLGRAESAAESFGCALSVSQDVRQRQNARRECRAGCRAQPPSFVPFEQKALCCSHAGRRLKLRTWTVSHGPLGAFAECEARAENILDVRAFQGSCCYVRVRRLTMSDSAPHVSAAISENQLEVFAVRASDLGTSAPFEQQEWSWRQTYKYLDSAQPLHHLLPHTHSDLEILPT